MYEGKNSLNIIVTGGAGYIGSHTCKALFKMGYNPITIDDLRNGHREFVQWGPFVEIDVTEKQGLASVFKEINPIAVIHLAGSIEAGLSVTNPLDFYENNVGGVINVLQAMAETNITRLIFASTAAVYGAPETQPIAETDPLKPINPYGYSKSMCEQVIRDTARALKLEYTIFRFFNAAGHDTDGDLWEWHDPETHLIPLAIKAACQNKSMQVFGVDYDTPDGSCIRDYIHVQDLANIMSQTIKDPSFFGQTCNIGTGRGASVLEILEYVKRQYNENLRIEYQGRRRGDPAVLVAKPSALITQRGWVTELSSINNIIKSCDKFPELYNMCRRSAS